MNWQNLLALSTKEPTWMFDWGTAFGIDYFYAFLTAKIILWIYAFCLIMVFLYAVMQMTLVFRYKKTKKKTKAPSFSIDDKNIPFLTVQLPLYNEYYVAERAIECISKLDYPKDKFEIQVLDDSTDETVQIVAQKVEEISRKKGLNIHHIRRSKRIGYKAGALDFGLQTALGEFVAIFDVDFLPKSDFLQETIPYFQNQKVGVVQTRWGHINKDYSLLTELQAFGLNAHFSVEQGGRNAGEHFINFNGTGGVWRVKCIEEAGGWQHDTLTEDLDLSYRAQLKNWKFKYLENVIAPAELPITMSALKGQQHRWMKGGAECFRKIIVPLITTKNVRLSDRLHGIFHLFNSSVFVFILLMSLLSLPVLHIKDSFESLNFYIQFGSVFILSTLFLMYYYWHSFRDKSGHKFKTFLLFIKRFFQFLTVSMGLALSNSVAVIEGYLGIKSAFIRTPKFNVKKKNGEKIENKYDKKGISIITIGEGILFLVFGFTAINRLLHGDLGMLPFHLMLSIGYATVFYYSIIELKPAWFNAVAKFKPSKVNS